MASNSDSEKFRGQDEQAIKLYMNQMRKKMEENGTIDKFKEAFDITIRDDESHKAMKEKISQILSSSEAMSYEDVFRKLGGAEFEKSTCSDDLDKILEKLVEKEVNISDETKDKFFKECERIYKAK